MKIISSILAALTLSSLISISSFAAEQPITVMIDQQKLDFKNNAPVNDRDSVLIPFRLIFEELGLQVKWDAKTKTIIGKKDGVIIELHLGSHQAIINGNVTPLTSAPKMIDDVAYVPLRFVGEATGNYVTWNASQNTVVVDTNTSISTFFDHYIKFSNDENYEGLTSLIDPVSPIAQAGSQLKSQMQKYDLTTTLNRLDILNRKANEATVHTVETTRNVNDSSFYLDNTTESIYTLTKQASDTSWRINNVQITGIQYSLPEDMLNSNVSIPKEDEDAVLGVLQSNFKYSNDKNLDGVSSTLDETSPQFNLNKKMYSQIFSTYDLSFNIESSKVIYYKDNEAAVYVVQTTKKIKGPNFTDSRSVTVNILKKTKDNKWKITQTYLVKSDNI